MRVAWSAGIGLILAALSSAAVSAQAEPSAQVLLVHDAQGHPEGKARLASLYLCDVLLNTFACQIETEDGRAVCRGIPHEPFAISMRCVVPGFGDVYLTADSLGRGYRVGGPLNLAYEFARSRLAHTREVQAALRRAGDDLSPETRERIARAQALLGRAGRSRDPAERSRLAYQSLQESTWAGEMAALEKARADIRRTGWRKGFKFGANAFGYGQDPRYAEQFDELFNYATLPFFLPQFEPTEGDYRWRRPEEIAAWLQRAGIATKGTPLLWFFAPHTPDYVKQKSFDELCDWVRQRTPAIIGHYAGSIDIWEVMNEPHVQNALNLTLDQMVEVTRLVTEHARAGNPKAVRIVNSCCLWTEYMKGQFSPDVRVCTPQQFLDRLRAAKVDYEVIGLQFYYPSRDLLEISRMIDRFARFRKPVHITEVAAPSSAEGDEYSYWKGPNAVRAMGVWHRPWDEELQAEWIEGFYTICYSKPFVEAITWWDFADYRPGHFFPNGGLLDHEYVPKKSFFRLKRLLNRWRRMG